MLAPAEPASLALTIEITPPATEPPSAFPVLTQLVLASTGWGAPAPAPAAPDAGDLSQLAETATALVGAQTRFALFGAAQLTPGGPVVPQPSPWLATARRGVPVILADLSNTSPNAAAGPGQQHLAARGRFLGVPLLTATGQVLGALGAVDPAGRRWSVAEIGALQLIAAQAVEQLARTAAQGDQDRRLLLEVAVTAAMVGTYDWNMVTSDITGDPRFLALHGYPPESILTLEGIGERMHPQDRAQVAEAVERAITGGVSYLAHYRLVLPGGEIRWLEARGRITRDDVGNPLRLLGAVFDVTATQEGDARLTRVLEAMPAGFCSLDQQWRVTYVNAEAARIQGLSREQLIGRTLRELIPASSGTSVERKLRLAAQTGEPVTFTVRHPAQAVWLELRAWPSAEGLSIYLQDVTVRVLAQQHALRVSRRTALLARVADRLSGSLDGSQSIGWLARLVAPALADWCVVTVVDPDAAPATMGRRDVGWWHGEEAQRDLLDRYCAVRRPSTSERSIVEGVLAAGQPRVMDGTVLAVAAQMLPAGPELDLLRELAPDSAAVLPLRGRSGPIGVLILFNGADRGPLSEEDLATAVEVADRTGMALENARLFDQQREMSEGLQRALLTAPAEPVGLEVAVRYAPAAQAAQVGGDWYDVFVQPAGATIAVIGDVVGHDTVAAASMGQLRTTLRTLAARGDDGPAQVLTGVDQVLGTLAIETAASVVVVQLAAPPVDDPGQPRAVRWSNAGHPPPMVVRPDGTVFVLSGAEADLLLGIDAGADRTQSEFLLMPGSVLVLYTDGLVERRGQSLDDGLALLQATLTALAGRPLPALCDELLARLLPARCEDDVALIAIRLHS